MFHQKLNFWSRRGLAQGYTASQWYYRWSWALWARGCVWVWVRCFPSAHAINCSWRSFSIHSPVCLLPLLWATSLGFLPTPLSDLPPCWTSTVLGSRCRVLTNCFCAPRCHELTEGRKNVPVGDLAPRTGTQRCNECMNQLLYKM